MESMDGNRQYVTFLVDNLYCGLDVLEVQEVLRVQPMTRVPLAPSVVCGLINLRGQIVTAIDLRRRLRLGNACEEPASANVVVRADDGAVSLMVDEIDDVIEVSENAFEAAPTTLAASARALVSGVCKLDRRLLMVLNLRKILDVSSEAPEFQQASR